LKGDLGATNALFSTLQKVLEGYFFARMNSKADAEDLSQIALLKIHFSRDRYDSSRRLKTWVFTLASRSLIDHWRGQHFDYEILGDDEESALESLESDLLDPERKTELHLDLNRALESLKPMDRSIVYLYGVEGLTMAEIAEIHGTSEVATKVRAHRAYRELRKLMIFVGYILFFLENYGRN